MIVSAYSATVWLRWLPSSLPDRLSLNEHFVIIKTQVSPVRLLTPLSLASELLRGVI